MYERHPGVAGLRWWSTYEALWANVTMFDRAVPGLRVQSVRALGIDDSEVVETADYFALHVVR
jgi:hypothetical protein